MRIAIFAYSRQGCKMAEKTAACFPDDEIMLCCPERIAENSFFPISANAKKFYGEQFSRSNVIIFIGACGIAVRETAPHIRDKRTDPAVLCIDELGRFVIPLLSGHIGGANQLSRVIAKQISATPVITTATDINGRFSVDCWAVKNNFAIDDIKLAKSVSAAVLEGEVPLCSDFPISGELPNGIVSGSSGEMGIYLTYRKKLPFEKTLRLIPKALHLGIGCRRGTDSQVIFAAVQAALGQNDIDIRAIKSVSSIDLKSDEEGLIRCCEQNGWEIKFYSVEELLNVWGDFTPSEFVKSVTGVDNVCERAALAEAERLIVRKTVVNGVTVAIAAENTEVCFG